MVTIKEAVEETLRENITKDGTIKFPIDPHISLKNMGVKVLSLNKSKWKEENFSDTTEMVIRQVVPLTEGSWEVVVKKESESDWVRALLISAVGLIRTGSVSDGETVSFTISDVHSPQTEAHQLAKLFRITTLTPKPWVMQFWGEGYSLKKMYKVFGVSENEMIKRIVELRLVLD